MAGLVAKIVRYFLPVWAAVAAIVSYHLRGWRVPTLALAILAAGLVVTWPVWSKYLIQWFELPAYRRESLDDAEWGRCDILFLRPLAVDQYWHQLQEFLLGVVRAYNSQYAAIKTVVAIGGDEGAIGNLPSTNHDWWEKVRGLGESADVIFILPVHQAPQSDSGIVKEILEAVVHHPRKAIFVMPPLAVWDSDLKATPVAGQLQRLWAETAGVLLEKSSAMRILPYDPDGCFWTLEAGHDGLKKTRYSYSARGAAEALFAVLDRQRITRSEFIRKHDPDGYAILRARKAWRDKKIPFPGPDLY